MQQNHTILQSGVGVVHSTLLLSNEAVLMKRRFVAWAVIIFCLGRYRSLDQITVGSYFAWNGGWSAQPTRGSFVREIGWIDMLLIISSSVAHLFSIVVVGWKQSQWMNCSPICAKILKILPWRLQRSPDGRLVMSTYCAVTEFDRGNVDKIEGSDCEAQNGSYVYWVRSEKETTLLMTMLLMKGLV